jgi:uncharacterized protein YbaP (TraB family)
MTVLNTIAASAGMPAGQIDIFRPWLAGLALSVAPLMKAGYDPRSGVELVLKARAEAAGKPIQAFETIDKQVGILASMSEADQLASLRLLMESWGDATAELDGIVAAWASSSPSVPPTWPATTASRKSSRTAGSRSRWLRDRDATSVASADQSPLGQDHPHRPDCPGVDWRGIRHRPR